MGEELREGGREREDGDGDEEEQGPEIEGGAGAE